MGAYRVIGLLPSIVKAASLANSLKDISFFFSILLAMQ